MIITLNKTINEAVCRVHIINDIAVTADTVIATVNSYSVLGGRILWQDRINVPMSKMVGNPYTAVLNYLVEPSSYLAGGLIGDETVELADRAYARMITVIDEERESWMMMSLTSGGAKKYEYSAKMREWQDFNVLGVTAALLLPLVDQKTRWPWASAEVAESGDNLQTVMARFKLGMDSSALARKIAARAQSLKRQLKAATTPAQRKAIFDARAWPTS